MATAGERIDAMLDEVDPEPAEAGAWVDPVTEMVDFVEALDAQLDQVRALAATARQFHRAQGLLRQGVDGRKAGVPLMRFHTAWRGAPVEAACDFDDAPREALAEVLGHVAAVTAGQADQALAAVLGDLQAFYANRGVAH